MKEMGYIICTKGDLSKEYMILRGRHIRVELDKTYEKGINLKCPSDTIREF